MPAPSTTMLFSAALLGLFFLTSAAEPGEQISLPEPVTDSDVSVEAAIKARRSVREYTKEPLTLADVSQLLWAAQGITERPIRRAAPSAGGLYPLEIYLVAGNVESLPAGVYRYRNSGQQLELLAKGDLRGKLSSAALSQAWVRRAPAVIVITGVYERTEKKYGDRAERYVRIEVGHAAQNVYLQAESLDLGTVMVGAFHDRKVQDVLALPRDHAPLALMPVGHPR